MNTQQHPANRKFWQQVYANMCKHLDERIAHLDRIAEHRPTEANRQLAALAYRMQEAKERAGQ